jgi:hypothetical protein
MIFYQPFFYLTWFSNPFYRGRQNLIILNTTAKLELIVQGICVKLAKGMWASSTLFKSLLIETHVLQFHFPKFLMIMKIIIVL